VGKITGGLHPNLTRFKPYKLHVHKKYTKLTSPNPLFALSRDLRLNKTIIAPGLVNEKTTPTARNFRQQLWNAIESECVCVCVCIYIYIYIYIVVCNRPLRILPCGVQLQFRLNKILLLEEYLFSRRNNDAATIRCNVLRPVLPWLALRLPRKGKIS